MKLRMKLRKKTLWLAPKIPKHGQFTMTASK